MKNKLSSEDEKLLNKFELFIESSGRDVRGFVNDNATTVRNLSNILILIHSMDVQEFMTVYSNVKCESPVCSSPSKYKVTNHNYDRFCSPECRYDWYGKDYLVVPEDQKNNAIIVFEKKIKSKIIKRL